MVRQDSRASEAGVSEVVSHFWVAQCDGGPQNDRGPTPRFSSVIFLIPHLTLAESPSLANDCSTRFELYDADGASANIVEMQFPLREVGIVELEPLLSHCKVEAGIQHGHLVVRSPGEFRHQCRIQGQGSAALHSGLITVRPRESAIFPVVIQRGLENLLAVVNYGVDPASVVVRLFVGNRAPEVSLTIPPHGSRLFMLEEEFFGGTDPFGGREQASAQAYIRILTRHQGSIGVQLVQPSAADQAEESIKILAAS